MAEPQGRPPLRITVVVCLGPRKTQEGVVDLPEGATVADALQACATAQGWTLPPDGGPALGIWGRAAAAQAPVRDGDRVEVYRPLVVDPKVARRERFARQGARSTGLFARQRPGGKAGY
ncbi:RnfH family protein [Acidovorax sp. M2(2025)]|uniref:RnfH family protein n=1 Tax=Acidovorax sp. M2(2025) TaxID=3411355 RepID=UPI003BF5A55E